MSRINGTHFCVGTCHSSNSTRIQYLFDLIRVPAPRYFLKTFKINFSAYVQCAKSLYKYIRMNASNVDGFTTFDAIHSRIVFTKFICQLMYENSSKVLNNTEKKTSSERINSAQFLDSLLPR